MLRSLASLKKGFRLLFVATFFLNVGPVAGAEKSLLLVGHPSVEASFTAATSDGDCLFLANGKTQKVAPRDLVRWSTRPIHSERREIILVDGSHLVLAESWTGQPTWQLDGDTISVTTQRFGKVDLRRNQVRAILLSAAKGLKQRTQFFDQISEDSKNDRKNDGKDASLHLTNGDQWQGQLVQLSKTAEGPRRVHWLPNEASEPLQLPENRIAAILFGSQERLPEQQKLLAVGISDGSLLITQSFVTNDKHLHVHLAGGVELIGSDSREVASLRSLTSSCLYLSDLSTADYLHKPYLEIPWPYRRDRNALGGPLQAADHTYSKGLGVVPTSRLTYRLDTKEYAGRFQRFVASVAVDDEADKRGSVIFRVLLKIDDEWQEAYTSPVVRGGDPPLPVLVELDDATQLAIVSGYADRGDECDYANWLDARLE